MYLYQQYGIELARDLHRERLEAAERYRQAKAQVCLPFTGFRKSIRNRLPRFERKPSQELSVKPVHL